MTTAQVVNSPSLSTTVLFRRGLGYTHRKDHIPPAYEPYKIEYGDQYIYIYTLVFKKVHISKIYISFVSWDETKEKTKAIYIYIYF